MIYKGYFIQGVGRMTTKIELDDNGGQVDVIVLDDTHELENYEIYTADEDGYRDDYLVDVETLEAAKNWINRQVARGHSSYPIK
jgi:hypothetical protein